MTTGSFRSILGSAAWGLAVLLIISGVRPSLGASHGIAMHGEPALPADFQHFNYANPKAPKGGQLRYGVSGTFDSLNPFIVKGSAARGIWDYLAGRNVYESLMQRNRNEPFTLYGLLAQSVATDEERTWVHFELNPKAKFADGKPVRPEDVIFSFKLLGEKGKPTYRNYWKKIKNITKQGDLGVHINFFDGKDRELPLLIAMMPILPEHAIDVEAFSKTTLIPGFGSGPYTISDVKPGSSITLTLREDYWAKELPSKVGFDNFKTIHFEYYRNENALFDAFKKGLFDVFVEYSPRRWANGYDFPAVKRGEIITLELTKTTPAPMQGYSFNMRSPKLADHNVRLGLTALFDFEWINKKLFNGAYVRTQSFWHGSNLSSFQRPASEEEKELLKPWLSEIDPKLLDGSFALPKSNGSGNDRSMLRSAFSYFKKAGYTIKNGQMVDQTGKPFACELLISNAKSQERLALAWQENAKKLGIAMSIRVVDHAQLERRKQNYDFDITPMTYTASFSPGAEQIGRWGSKSKDLPGTFNLSGVAHPGIDALISTMVQARDRKHFDSTIRAFDRLLLNGAYILPHYHLNKQWIAVRNNIKMPKLTPLYGVQYPTWWDANAQ